jgi:uncharacterized iron-regulated protein
MPPRPTLLAASALAACLAASCASTGGAPAAGGILDARRGRSVDFEDMVDDLAGVRVVYVGESHTNPEHHEIQRRILEALSLRRPHLMVGMEMLQRPYQPTLDRWSAGEMEEGEFLREANWYGQWSDWRLYAPILRLARDRRIRVVGLNVDRAVIREVNRSGVDGLPPWMRVQIPPTIDTSVSAHRKAIHEVFFGHPGMDRAPDAEGMFQRFYEAQCTWDEVMAESTVRALAHAPADAAIVVLAGAMHVKGFQAIPERARRRNGLDYRVVLPLERDEFPDHGITTGMGRPADYVIATAPTPAPGGARLGVALRGGDAFVKEVVPGGAAEAAGLQVGDVLLSLDGTSIVDTVDLRMALEGRSAGERVLLRWTRAGTAMEAQAVLSETPGTMPAPAK